MPNLIINTNLPRKDIPEDFLLNILPVFSQVMGRPSELLFVTLATDKIQVFNRDESAPVIVASISAVGSIGPELNRVSARALTDFMEQALGVNRERILISFIDMDPSNVARSGNTFA